MTTTKSEEREGGNGIMWSELKRQCPKCGHLSPKIIERKDEGERVRFKNREVCLDPAQLEAGKLVQSACQHDKVLGIVVVTQAELQRQLENGDQDGGSLEKRTAFQKLQMRIEHPEKYWIWLEPIRAS